MPAFGELFILVPPGGRRSLRRLVPGQDIHGNDGVIPAALLAETPFGTEVATLKGVPCRVLKPSLYDLTRGIKRRTQILYPKDIGYICMRLGVGNGSRVIEAGSGSGSMTLALSWFSGESGQVYSYEARREFLELCRRNLEWAGVGGNVSQYERDIAEGFDQTDADALFLDLREPWLYLDQSLAAVKGGGLFAFLLPTAEQVSMLLKGMETRDFDDVEVEEVLVRPWKAVADRLRPADRMTAHTGFLIFARRQERSRAYEDLKPAGTRERKQRRALAERLREADGAYSADYPDEDNEQDRERIRTLP
ncbi:MAG: tRNA (adenine-N1)-methyltransferase [Desulfovibrio sp.]|nr:tRNA (adenine-N1)-methyltransferase [Desulfovibrio sp.]